MLLDDTLVERYAQQYIEINQEQWCPIRTYAQMVGVAKSTLHYCFANRLPNINPILGSQYKQLAKDMQRIGRIKGGCTTWNIVVDPNSLRWRK